MPEENDGGDADSSGASEPDDDDSHPFGEISLKPLNYIDRHPIRGPPDLEPFQ